jgi:hypothetical protein
MNTQNFSSIQPLRGGADAMPTNDGNATRNIFEGAYYVLNSDNKIELHLNGKEGYTSLPENVKTNIKRAFIWGRQRGAWVSRSKDSGIPYSMREYKIPLQQIDERKEYTEAREQKIERAENKADRYEGYAESREKEAAGLQAEFNRMRKDWSWLTQPNVNTSGGRSFTRQREKVYARYDRGMQSLTKAEQHKQRAQDLRLSASEGELKSESYLLNRVKEGEKAVRDFEKFTTHYGEKLENIDAQNDEAKAWLTARMNYYNTAFEKLEFFGEALNELTIQRTEAGQITHADVKNELSKKEVKKYFKDRFNIDLEKFVTAFGRGCDKYYYIKTTQPLPVQYHSGWAADNAGQVNGTKLLKDIREFNA